MTALSEVQQTSSRYQFRDKYGKSHFGSTVPREIQSFLRSRESMPSPHSCEQAYLAFNAASRFFNSALRFSISAFRLTRSASHHSPLPSGGRVDFVVFGFAGSLAGH